MSAYLDLEAGASRVAGAFIRRVHYGLLDRGYDRGAGAETNGKHQPHELSIASDNIRFASEYAPTPTRVFSRVISAVEADLRDFVFVDLGSGKGRTLLLAAELPFRRIEGVEFAAELHEAAKRNIATLAGRGCRSKVVAHHVDAAEYRIPDEPCIFYLYNPFGTPVMSRVLDNIEASFHRTPRPIYFLYLNPKLGHLFEQRSFIRTVPRSWKTRLVDRLAFPEPLNVYRALPESTFRTDRLLRRMEPA